MIRTGRDMIERIHATDEDPPVVRVEELDPGFFDLSTGVAGDIVQALANYRLAVTIEGDLPPHSQYFAQFARECAQLRFR